MEVLRRMRQHPLTASGIICTLALGVGLATTAFAFLDELVWGAWTTFADPRGVVKIENVVKTESGVDTSSKLPLSLNDYERFRDTETFSALAGSQFIEVTFAHGNSRARLNGEMVTSNYFSVARVELALGRTFSEDENRAPGIAPVVVLGHRFWLEQFGGSDVLGQQVELNRHPFTVIGVAPKGFVGSHRLVPADFWVPLMMYRQVFMAPQLVETPGGQFLQVHGRLAQGTDLAVARERAERITQELTREFPKSHGQRGVIVSPVSGEGASSPLKDRLGRLGLSLMGTAVAFLLIACVNITNLFLVRVQARSRALAIKQALGATPSRLGRELLFEAVALALLGGAAGMLLAWGMRQFIWHLRPGFLDSHALTTSLQPAHVGFALLLALLIGLGVGVLPMLQMKFTDLSALLHRERRARLPGGGGVKRATAARLMVAIQVALGTATLGLAWLFMHSFLVNARIDPGFEVDHLLVASMNLDDGAYSATEVRTLQGQLVDRLRALPGVSGVALNENRLLGGFRMWRNVATTPTGDGEPLMAGSSLIDEGLFETASIPLVVGRSFEARDSEGQRTLVLSRVIAERLFESADTALGHQLWLDQEAEPYQVVGVAADVDVMRVGEPPRPFVYLPLDRFGSSRFTIHLRARGRPAALMPEVRQEIQRLAPDVLIRELRPIRQALLQSLWMSRLSAWLLSGLGVVALLLATLGVTTVATANTGARRREVGIRMAFGARRSQVVAMFLRRDLVWLLAGCLVGLVLAVTVSSYVQGLLYQAGDLGLVVMTGAAGTLLLCGLLASVGPAWRTATRSVAPILREEI